jgi:Ca2+-binding EF-hand superfamily protein
MDDDNSKSLSKPEFNKALTDYKLGFTTAENGALFEYFDVDSSGSISYDEFIRAVRGPMNMNRKKVVAQAFKKLDADGNGWIDINDIRGVYKANKHPDVISGKKTEDQILNEFLSTFELAHSMRSGEAPNYVVTKEEFEEYYNNVSCSIDDDLYFAAMMNSAWKLDQKPGQGATKGWSNAKPRAAQDNNIFNRPDPTEKKAEDKDLDLNASQQQLKEHIRKRIAARGARGLMGIAKKFKIADDNGNGLLDVEEFKKAMHDFRMGLSAQ